MMSISKDERSECSWCATRTPTKDLGEYEISWRYHGQRDATRGYYVCIKCKNWMENLIQQKVTHTWMIIKARAEKPCCGGGG